ncbi:MAG TPA: hypothetical protein VMG58_09040 [Candidatus Sulfotelmatobacter sp.]|nr:hypothetical protein [Candidatus Sulfotelmatobacter sp.]
MATQSPLGYSASFGKVLDDFVYNFVYLPTTNWQRAFSPTFNFGCNLEDVDVEHHVLDQVGSYGSQLSSILRALKVLIANLPADTLKALTPQEQQDLGALRKLADGAEQAVADKRGQPTRGITGDDVVRVINGLEALAKDERTQLQYQELVQKLRAAIPELSAAGKKK